MTANTFQEDREKAQEAGMTGFLPKPFDVSQLYEALENSAVPTNLNGTENLLRWIK